MYGLYGSFNHFPQITKKMHTALKQSVWKTARDTKNLIADVAPKDTGFMADSVYVTGAYGSTYGSGVSKAGKLKANNKGIISRKRIQSYVKKASKQRQQEAVLFNEVPPPPDDMSAYVVCGAYYSVYVEMGTRKMAAQPFFYPSVESMRSVFAYELSTLEAKIAAGGF